MTDKLLRCIEEKYWNKSRKFERKRENQKNSDGCLGPYGKNQRRRLYVVVRPDCHNQKSNFSRKLNAITDPASWQPLQNLFPSMVLIGQQIMGTECIAFDVTPNNSFQTNHSRTHRFR